MGSFIAKGHQGDTVWTLDGIVITDEGGGSPTYQAGALVTGTLQDGTPYSVPTFVPNAAVVAANGNSRLLTNRLEYGNQYHGVDIVLLKRMSNRWMMNLGASKKLAVTRANVSLDADVFNVLNANTTLAAQTNVASPNFQLISLNLSPRILRFGLRVTF
jgi:hypothetical protein